MIGVDVVRAWPRRFESRTVRLPDTARVADAVAAVGWTSDAETVAYAIHGQCVAPDAPLRDGDRVELLRPLLADPKEARRRRAGGRPA